MAVKTQAVQREFSYNGIALPEIGLQFSPTEVRDVYSATYPELASAEVTGPEQKGDKLVFTFKRAVGTKGAFTATRTFIKMRSDGLEYVEVVPAGTMTLTERLHQLGDKIDAVLFGTDLTKTTPQPLVRQ